MQTYQVEAAILIQHQVLITNLQGSVQQLEERINNQILGEKGLIQVDCLAQVDQQLICMMFMHDICPNSPKKKDNLQCIADI